MGDEGEIWGEARKQNQAKRERNLREGEAELEVLVAQDYRVRQLSPYHFRVNERLDIWPSTKKWWDTRLKRGGRFNNLVAFVKTHLK